MGCGFDVCYFKNRVTDFFSWAEKDIPHVRKKKWSFPSSKTNGRADEKRKNKKQLPKLLLSQKKHRKLTWLSILPVKVRAPLNGAKGVGSLQDGSGIKSHQGPAVAV